MESLDDFRPHAPANSSSPEASSGAALCLTISLATILAIAGCKKDPGQNLPHRIPKVYKIGSDQYGPETDSHQNKRKRRPQNSPTLMPHSDMPPRPAPSPPQPEAEDPRPTQPDPPQPEPPQPEPPTPSPETPGVLEKIHFGLAINFSPDGIPGQISITPPAGWEFELKTGTSANGTVEYLLILKNPQTGQASTVDITPHMTELLTSRSAEPLSLEADVPGATPAP